MESGGFNRFLINRVVRGEVITQESNRRNRTFSTRNIHQHKKIERSNMLNRQPSRRDFLERTGEGEEDQTLMGQA
jgi:hypothetical protein